ncbi:hypothetical protein M3Y99_00202000 [Aphelenchoides fujianensis]|nr:hypothetical protein M3Y99_00202000 [Aphelenchoides fujianensis]
MAETTSATTSSSSSTRRPRPPPPTEYRLSIWLKFSRILFGRIRKLPPSMSTTLVLLSVHIYLTVPVIIACGAVADLHALLRPFRAIKDAGFHFEELDEEYRELL